MLLPFSHAFSLVLLPSLLVIAAHSLDGLPEDCAVRPIGFLALEGGGVKGISYGGAAHALEEAGVLSQIHSVAGSSAGAAAAALLCANFTAAEMTAALVGTRMKELMDDSTAPLFSWLGDRARNWSIWLGLPDVPGPLEDLSRLATEYGWFKGEAMGAHYDRLIGEKTGKANTTFQQLHALFGKELRITSTCLTDGRLAYLDRNNTPHMPVSLAVRLNTHGWSRTVVDVNELNAWIRIHGFVHRVQLLKY